MSDFPRSDFPDDVRLADALRSLPVPELSAGFDDRVLDALCVSVPWWRRLWQPVQPLLLGTSCSLVLTLLLLHLMLNVPSSAPMPAFAAPSNLAAARTSGPPLDTLLDRPDLCAGSLAAAWNSVPADTGDGADTEKAERRPEPRRRAEVMRRLTLVV